MTQNLSRGLIRQTLQSEKQIFWGQDSREFCIFKSLYMQYLWERKYCTVISSLYFHQNILWTFSSSSHRISFLTKMVKTAAEMLKFAIKCSHDLRWVPKMSKITKGTMKYRNSKSLWGIRTKAVQSQKANWNKKD